jgi:UDP-N-acetylglucosamine--N-acetylmuramyl-(pentapeptide) pyrophosphoryl-undecaprenol N-acetylglucosamine transferase
VQYYEIAKIAFSLIEKVYCIMAHQHSFRALFAAGGTGGHLFPALAVAEQLRIQTNSQAAIEFVGTAEKLESTIVPKHGYAFHAIPMRGLQSLFSFDTLTLPFRILSSLALCHRLLRQFRPDCVVCAGAYLSYPVGLAASQQGIPLYLMESNAIPGRTIVQLAPRATTIFLSFEDSLGFFHQQEQAKAVVVGNPVRAAFTQLPPQEAARVEFGLAANMPTVLCFGGSLGARSLNQTIQAFHQRLNNEGIQVLWQTGKAFEPVIQPTNTPAQTVAIPFIDNMAAAYAAADVIVCRAGATTIAEVANIQTQASKIVILVPYPHAAHDHQTANARSLERHGAAFVVEDGCLAERFLPTLQQAFAVSNTPEQALLMSNQLRTFAKPEAARVIAEMLLQQ